ncbi:MULTISPECIES: hypothetical protein [unclassified Mesorhizobium]|uniref:hypothetical protein n=1 Tax=unclassified Mesorhizobium TaxID=325217 RepID=UPI000FCCD6F7|nr:MULTISPECIES: hypothetical protein [unclassified Mesorhizobium]RUW40411.1 hypothetical protein EOA37_15020 [Mesorhizobium sp. M2A.F.Ca.ET.015.02.1.1]RVC97946.1 hypothetical protein EN739_02535 [Mesorhizobium sp. M2A.F.Ca.ET.017.03.2.1]RVD08014.1 hypothetical protein EN753_15800 [Mesorhizobium sp. M2A.F.Ca.ET.029.05.1.1]RWB40637.1 MAG: hypothetical protein EOQ46_24310 [Mesorhizobium sp.]RWB62704.1 MAG: hypothetical protein EOQ48_11295 [Mesorhizobium sp.]
MLLFDHGPSDLYALMNKELGSGLPPGGSRTQEYWPFNFQKIELRDVLDSITLVARYCEGHQNGMVFIKEARRILAEEQVRYRIDDKGGVHFTVDADFERTRVSTVSELATDRYKGVRNLFDDAFLALDQVPPDGKSGIRHAFFAVESLFRLIFPDAHQLSGGEVKKHLGPLIDKLYGDQKPAIHLAHKQLASLREWIDGAHFYRHEPGSEEPAQPPLDLAIYTISQSGGHLRWLALIDRKSK